ncbi:unnamed protein product [Cylicocyclus nassatus]|uniref:Uncharacterized protein n=1 Tax=Cylicocyclus nassatus TaxID=53992 RepID=A0AA36M7M1_CYLNA|nr:unnamed protein product [Cylicocyclus nassatus]
MLEDVFSENPFNSSLKVLLEKRRNALTPHRFWNYRMDVQCEYLCSDVGKCPSRFQNVTECVLECLANRVFEEEEDRKNFFKKLEDFFGLFPCFINSEFYH